MDIYKQSSLLPSLLSQLIKKKRILILSDNITHRIAAERCEKILKEIKVSSLILFPQGSKRVYAEEKYLPEILKRSQDRNVIITVGTGTITDLGKYAAHQFKEEVFPLVYPSKKIKEYLRKAKCPLCFEQIGVNKKLAYKTIIYARYIRGRLTILDIADELGILKETAKDLI